MHKKNYLFFLIFSLMAVSIIYVSPIFAQTSNLFVSLPTVGNVPVTLHPGTTVTPGNSTRVAFGVPFPRNVVTNVNNLHVKNSQGIEIPSHVEELTRWRSLSGDTSVDSLRAALIYIDVTFIDTNPVVFEVNYGTPRTAFFNVQTQLKDSWTSIANEINPDEYPLGENIQEPSVYATLPADWLSQCLLRTRTTSIGSDTNWQWFDEASVEFGKTAVNDVSKFVTEANRIDYVTQYEPWLFDRAMTLFGLYIRTGELKWLRHAHRAVQFYANHINTQGYFDLKSYNDLKYSYGQAMLLDIMLTGDTSLLTKIEQTAGPGSSWPETYRTSLNFWTERHQAYSLLSALSAWEATGKTAYAQRVDQIVQTSLGQALNPPEGWNADGCLLHSYGDHEGSGSQQPTCSPWMSALFADAMWRYYLHSNDQAALQFFANLGDYVYKYALFEGTVGEVFGRVMPNYLASSAYKAPGNQWSDYEHTCDVAGLIARAAWAKGQLGYDPTTMLLTSQDLLDTCQYDFNHWHRAGSDVNYGKTPWRLAPPRKFSWWFGTTSDLEWLLANVSTDGLVTSVVGQIPAPGAIDIKPDIKVTFTLADFQDGVDLSTVIVKVNDVVVYNGSNPNAYPDMAVKSALNKYVFTYTPTQKFDYSKIVTIQIDAQNLNTPIPTIMPTVNYSFTIEDYYLPAILTNVLSDAYQQKNYNVKLQGRGTAIPYYWFLAEGVLPPGIALDNNSGALNGVPLTVGVSEVTIGLRDNDGQETTKTFTLEVKPFDKRSISIIRQDCTEYTGCYTSLASWANAEKRNLIASNEIAVARIEGQWTQADNNTLNLRYWNTGPDNYIHIYTTPEARHHGVANTGYRIMGKANRSLFIYENFVRIDGLEIDSTLAYNIGIQIVTGTSTQSDIRVSNSIFYGGGTSIAIGTQAAGDHHIYAWNNISYDNTFVDMSANSNKILHAYSNTIRGRSVIRTNNTAIYKNNILFGNDAFLGVGTYAGVSVEAYNNALKENNSNNWTSGSDNIVNQTFAFVDESNNDFHISANDTSVRDKGLNTSSELDPLNFTTDVDGHPRSEGSGWDIGANEQAGLERIPPTPRGFIIRRR